MRTYSGLYFYVLKRKREYEMAHLFSIFNGNLKQNVFAHFAYTGKVYVYTLSLLPTCTKCTETNFFQSRKQK